MKRVKDRHRGNERATDENGVESSEGSDVGDRELVVEEVDDRLDLLVEGLHRTSPAWSQLCELLAARLKERKQTYLEILALLA